MPGIFGYLNFDTDEKNGKEILFRMGEILRGHSSASSSQGRNPYPSGLGVIGFDHDPRRVLTRDGFAFAAYGYLYDRTPLIQRLRPFLPQAEQLSMEELLLHTYEHFGIHALCGLNGRYVAAIWSASDKTLTLVNDRHGFMPLFYWHDGRRFMFAPEYKAISWHPEFKRTIDGEAVLQFLYYGHLLEDYVLFKHIRILPPASILNFSQDAVRITSYWQLEFRPSPEVDFDECMEEYHLRLHRALRRQTVSLNHCHAAISGGLDSRIVLSLLAEGSGKKISAVSYGHRKSSDVVFARALAKICGAGFRRLNLPYTFLKEDSAEFVRRTEGLATLSIAHILRTMKYAQHLRIHHLVTGFFGDIINGDTLFDPISEGASLNRSEAFSLCHKKYNVFFQPEELERYGSQGMSTELIQTPADISRTSFFRAGASSFHDKNLLMEIRQRQRRRTLFVLNLIDQIGQGISPFIDNTVIDFMLTVPEEIRAHKRLHHGLLQRFFPEAAGIPRDLTGVPIQDASPWTYPWLFTRWYWRKSQMEQQILRVVAPRRHSYQSNSSRMHWTDAFQSECIHYLLPEIETMLESESFLWSYLQPDRIRFVLNEFKQGKLKEGRKLLALYTLWHWEKQFLN